jgi:hypothetical protein
MRMPSADVLEIPARNDGIVRCAKRPGDLVCCIARLINRTTRSIARPRRARACLT